MMFVFPGWDTLVFLVWLIQIPQLESVFAPKFRILCGNSRIFNNKTYSFKKNISYPRRYPQQQSQIPISIKWFDQFYSTSVLGLSIALGFPCCLITQWTKRTKITSLGCCWGGGSVSGECFNKNATNLEWLISKKIHGFYWDKMPFTFNENFVGFIHFSVPSHLANLWRKKSHFSLRCNSTSQVQTSFGWVHILK